MAPVALFFFTLLTHLLVLHSAEEDGRTSRCPVPYCDGIGKIGFPFRSTLNDVECGLFPVNCSNPDHPTVQLKEGYWLEFEGPLTDKIHINDRQLQAHRTEENCSDKFFDSLSLPKPPPIHDVSIQNFTLFKCDNSFVNNMPQDDLTYHCQNNLYTYYSTISDDSLPNPTPSCSKLQIPIPPIQLQGLHELTFKFVVQLTPSEACLKCHQTSGECLVHEGRVKCSKAKDNRRGLKIGLGIGLGVGGTALAVCLFILWSCRQRLTSSYFVSRNISSQPYSNSDIEGCTAYFGVPVFSYNELEEATNHFNSEKELGDGGFGTVYHGILKDGREVAVKRLYEHNYKRVEQFKNEIEILTRIRHKNLVSLYGCTSRRSRELLLVYEYIPNGTVADHLHGDRVDPGSLTWPIRMSIAIETASALSYLHASDIVHRDVKTTNILLDNNFCVKVADFGLSRLFPLDVTHVSTAPQGTPGYVDPEYHQCYQLTSKSDVYSFGVVLIELISSMPAVDISRHRHEINLSNLAISKIQKGLFSELVDPYLGFESDDVVRRMIVLVAELAFQCLQQDNDMRPTMNEVLEALKIIESGNDVPQTLKPVFENAGMKTSVPPPPSPDCDEIGLLKNMRPEFSPFSPVSVTQQWPSTRSTTPSASI